MSSLIKQHFTTRYPEGILLNGDLSQVEIICFAQLTRDYNLIKLLNEGVDIHKYMYNIVYGTPIDQITKEMRSNIKKVDFGIIYGNGPKTASERTGLPEEECKQIIDEFYKAFPNTKVWQQYNLKAVEKQGYLKSITGARFNFKKYPANYQWQIDKGIVESYNPPDIKNYPVQNLAFTIICLILGQFFRQKAIYNREKYLLINTVHDSLMLDCQTEKFCDDGQKDIQEIVDNLPSTVYTKWRVKLLVPIIIDFGRGRTWHDIT